MPHKIGLVQMNSRDNLAANLEFMRQKIIQAAEEGVELIAFPENCCYLGENREEKFRLAQSLNGDLVSRFQEYARDYQLSILLGSIYERIPSEPQRLYNTSVLISREGQIQAAYRKIHLCDIDSPSLRNLESETIKPGDEAVVIAHDVGKIGLSICYDLRFPGLYQHLARAGATLIFVPSAFFLQTGKNHWFPLLQARAIENQVYLAAPAQWGWHYGTRFSYGNSVLIDPWGTILMCAQERPGLITSPIDLEYLQQIRENMPVLSHRRPECYGI